MPGRTPRTIPILRITEFRERFCCTGDVAGNAGETFFQTNNFDLPTYWLSIVPDLQLLPRWGWLDSTGGVMGPCISALLRLAAHFRQICPLRWTPMLP
jgi:hypothetical protein